MPKTYELYREGTQAEVPLILMLPGVNCGAWLFRGCLPYFLPHYQVALMNNPGVDGAPIGLTLSVNDLVHQAEDIIAELNPRELYVVGHSMGGFTAQRLALRNPGRIKRLVLVGTSYGQPRSAEDINHLTQHVGMNFWDYNRELNRHPETAYKHLFGPQTPDAIVQHFVHGRRSHDVSKTTSALHLTAGGAFSSYGEVQRLETPTLVVHGTADHLVSYASGEKLARQIPHARLWSLDGVGHFPMLENASFYPRILDFIRGDVVGEETPKDNPPHKLKKWWEVGHTILNQTWKYR